MREMGLLIAFCGALAVFSPDTPVLAQDKDAATKKEKPQEVIAEGVGATADEALKDAYRNAVRQVVGAVVDAETLVENDEVIDDKVLTYSDGFIKGYEEVAGSKKMKGGLHRIKIKAQVERRSVIVKLKAANVTVKDVDGKGLFAEAVTQLDAEKDAAALLKKQFEGFPQSCLTATVVGKPEIVEKTAEQAKVKLTVQIEPDLKAFKAFSDRVIPVLEKIAKEKGEFTAKYTPDRIEQGALVPANRNGSPSGDSDLIELWMPKAFSNGRGKPGLVSIAVATSRTKAADSIDYKYFTLDASLEPAVKAMVFRTGQCKLQLLDADGEVIATDRFAPSEESKYQNVFYGSVVLRKEHDFRGTQLTNVFLAPVFGRMDRSSLNYGEHRSKRTLEKIKPVLNISRTLTLSLDELKSVKDAKVKITFDDTPNE